MKNEIILFENENVKLEVNLQDETVWLTQAQMAELFKTTRNNVTMHITNCYEEGELEENSTSKDFLLVQKEGNRQISRSITHYNLDIIISVGYRVKSKVGTQFRIWANKILKQYLLEGYVANQKRLEYLEKTIKLIDIATRIDEEVGKEQGQQILKVIRDYTVALDLLDNYDYKEVKKPQGTINTEKKLEYKECLKVISKMKFNEKSNLFALERDNGLESIINNIYQTFAGEDVYKSIEEKGANLLYLIVKNHVFADGNKRIAATIFLYFLDFYGILYRENKKSIEPETLVATTLLIAESNPREKEIIIDLVMNFLNE
jgi:death-on-curing family protein